MELKKVMLAIKAKEFESLKYPLLASPKIDGVRATNKNGQLVSRTMTVIPNGYTQKLFSGPNWHGFDGELVVGEPNHPNCMQTTMSGAMTRDGTPEITWYVFDRWDLSQPYIYRAKAAKEFIESYSWPNGVAHVKWLPQTVIKSVEELYAYEDARVLEGYEGVILRAPQGIYKQNRSTIKEGLMMKVKRFQDSEAEILGAYELMHNDNEATTDARGFTKRSTHQENKRASGLLGGFNVRDVYDGREFDVGTGFTLEQRKNLWQAWQKNPRHLTGYILKYKHFPVGVVDKPRHPIFLGFRDRRDM
jgi:DNA ligase-1